MKTIFLYTTPQELTAWQNFSSPMHDDCDAILCGDFDQTTAQNYTHIVMASSAQNDEFISILGAQLNRHPITRITKIIDAHTFVQPAYSDTILRTVTSVQYPLLLSLSLPLPASQHSTHLHDAAIVVGGGKGMQNKDNFSLITQLADALGGATGATLDVIQSGWADPDQQIGQTGYSINARLYIACGISGAAHHVAGIRRAKTVIAINTNPHAPIFQHADYGYVGDAVQIVPALITRFKS